jgi:hypothetical protein
MTTANAHDDGATFSVGDRVHHAKFGAGSVIASGRKGSLVVAFDRGGTKQVMSGFLVQGSAEIIEFPRSRIIREIRHGSPVVGPRTELHER